MTETSDQAGITDSERRRDYEQTLMRIGRRMQENPARLVEDQAPSLLTIPGCGAITAAKIVGETAGGPGSARGRPSPAGTGTAPIPVWSSNTDRVRLNRAGNRQVNAALHRIAITQAGRPTLGRTFIERRLAAGDTRTEALRLLRRRLSDVVFRTLLADELDLQCRLSDHPWS